LSREHDDNPLENDDVSIKKKVRKRSFFGILNITNMCFYSLLCWVMSQIKTSTVPTPENVAFLDMNSDYRMVFILYEKGIYFVGMWGI